MTCGGYSRPMTDPSRGTRARRGVRRPGWVLLTVLLVLAIGASSALVFTSRVELLKLAVILALWAAVVAAFVSDHGEWAAHLGYRAIWLVGPTADLTRQLC